MKKFLYILVIVCSLAGCNYNSADDYLPGDFVSREDANITIAEVQDFYKYGKVTTFRRDYIIEGIVTANDRTGNFFRTFIIEDDTGALEIKAGVYDLYPLFPEGRRIYVRLTGLTLGKYEGMFQIGFKSAPGSGYDVDYLTTEQLMDAYVVRGGMEDGEVVPFELGVAELTDAHVGRLVKLRGLTLEDGGGVTWAISADESWDGNPGNRDIKASDANDDQVLIYTSGYADFARELTPAGVVDITGVVMKRGNSFRIKMRDLNDVAVN